MPKNNKAKTLFARMISFFNRRTFMMFFILILACGLLSRAAFLQLWQSNFLQDEGNDRVMRKIPSPALRGMIVDRNNEILAASSPTTSFWADPRILIKFKPYFPELAKALDIPLKDFKELIETRSNRGFIWLKRQLGPEEASAVIQKNIPGVYKEREYRRFYADAEVTSHILGFTDIEDKGQEGIENSYNSWLTGQEGEKQVIRDSSNRIVEEISTKPAIAGKDLRLTIDRRIQYLAYRALKSAVLKNNAVGGTLVFVDARTGDILAMVNQPAGNPNDKAQRKAELLRNRALTDTFEPGSTIKPFVVAAGLESGKWKANTPLDISSPYQVGKNTIQDVHNYGFADVMTVITKSSNVGVSKIAFSLGPKTIWEMYHNVGFGQLSQLNFRGEQRGILTDYKKWNSPFDFAVKSFGYGLTTNAVELAQAYVPLANSGLKTPLRITLDSSPQESTRVMSAKVANQMVEMMETAITKGSGKAAAVPGYRAAGKSGTARKVVHGQYSSDKHRGSFAGIAPVSDPRYVLVVMIDEPKNGQYYGGLVAGPVFSEVMGGALRLLGVAPDAEIKVANLPNPTTKPIAQATNTPPSLTTKSVTQASNKAPNPTTKPVIQNNSTSSIQNTNKTPTQASKTTQENTQITKTQTINANAQNDAKKQNSKSNPSLVKPKP